MGTKRKSECTTQEYARVKMQKKAWRLKNLDKVRKYAREHNSRRYHSDKDYREKCKAYTKAWRKIEPEKTRHRERSRLRYQNSAEVRAYYSAYRKTYKVKPDVMIQYRKNERAAELRKRLQLHLRPLLRL